jgi:hypothetical protein
MKNMNLGFGKENFVRSSTKNVFRRSKFISVITTFFLFVFCLTTVSKAQDTAGQDLPPDMEPPPIKVISKDEKKQLEEERDFKKRTVLALELMDSRLNKAEEANSKKEFKEMFNQLGRFHAIVDNTLRFLNRNNNDSRKILNNFKRFEIGLRKLLPRIELIRREVPQRYQFYVMSLIKNVRDARSKAVEPFFADSVVREDDGK